MVLDARRATLSVFNELWDFVVKRTHHGVITVQEHNELEHVFNLMRGCESYLEIGTAEGNSLYVLAHALKPGAKITCIDLGEAHTKPHQEEIRKLLSQYPIGMFHGDSTDPRTYPNKERHEVVLIDGGHDYMTVKSDISMYAPLATKYLLFHDVKMPSVKQAVDEYVRESGAKYYEFINSPTMGYGIVEIK